ncbi:VOC family protein [Mucilaginibacter sp. X4EP1]|jgi:PhnB protein|uniref:VOC family protein n=1 Tax=Mucilaginibacter sp. X4EP1 TaxID=2723092 RepID=UPI002167730C|nr:VOC family protein [Mucilaginibacter sp. X4EP1]MCS3816186.1 PhnB protein [Mucilaginibacter sp. X4EP1]
MASVSIYLNFNGNAEEAFNHYKKAFGTEFSTPIMRFKDTPRQPGAPELSEADQNKVAHVALPILSGIQIMGTDILESMGQKLVEGNNFTINLSPDTTEEADKLFNDLSEGGADSVPPHDEFWGYWGTCKDRFGIRWMFNIVKQQW